MATLSAPSNHSPNEDAEALRKAFEGVIILFVYTSLQYVKLFFD